MTGNNRQSALEAIEDLILVVQIILLHLGQGEEGIRGIDLVDFFKAPIEKIKDILSSSLHHWYSKIITEGNLIHLKDNGVIFVLIKLCHIIFRPCKIELVSELCWTLPPPTSNCHSKYLNIRILKFLCLVLNM